MRRTEDLRVSESRSESERDLNLWIAHFYFIQKKKMSDALLNLLVEIASHIITLIGLAYIPLVTVIIFRAVRLRGLNEENMADRLMDLCFDTLREEMEKQIDRCLKLYFCPNYILPEEKTLKDILFYINDYENLDELLTIIKNLSEKGIESIEFDQILLFLAQWEMVSYYYQVFFQYLTRGPPSSPQLVPILNE